jgi:NADPH2:quinone reductase
MRAIQISRHGGPEVLELVDLPSPEPGVGQVLVEVEAAGVNFMDVYAREDSGKLAPGLPRVLGAEGAGTVVKLGEQVTTLAAGDSVVWKASHGSYAEQVVVSAGEAVRVPDKVEPEIAAAVMLQGITAHYLATATYAVQPGDSVLVHAAAGGVGQLLTQIVKFRGGRVIATVSTDAKEAVARALGADEVVRYDREDFLPLVRQLTDGLGVHAVYDGVGAATFESSLSSLRRRGMLVLYGAASGRVPPFDLQRLNPAGSLFVTRPTIGDYTSTRDELEERAGDVLSWVSQGRLKVNIGGRYPLENARRAHEDLEARKTTGKLLLRP